MSKSKNLNFWLVVAAIFVLFVTLLHSILLPFVLGMAIAYFLDPVADKLQRLGLSRGISTLFIIATFFSLIIVVLMIALPVMAAQLSALMDAIPNYVMQFERNIIPTLERKLRMVSPTLVQEIKSTLSSSSWVIARTVAAFFGNALTSGVAFVNIISLVLITPIVAFYFLRDWDKITQHMETLIPLRHKQTVCEQLAIINQTLAGFVRGQFNVCILLGLYYATMLSLVGVNFGFVIGLATGFLVIFPYVGLLVGMSVGLMVTFFQFDDVTPVLIVLAIFVSGQIIEGNFVTPKLVGDKVGLHPVWIIFAMLAGATLFGFVGILLAVPVAAVLGVLTRFALLHYRQSTYFQ